MRSVFYTLMMIHLDEENKYIEQNALENKQTHKQQQLKTIINSVLLFNRWVTAHLPSHLLLRPKLKNTLFALYRP